VLLPFGWATPSWVGSCGADGAAGSEREASRPVAAAVTRRGRIFDLRLVEFYTAENAIARRIQCPPGENDPAGDHRHAIEHRIHRPPRETLPITEHFHCPYGEIHPKA
jgi:hypothetical protein